MSGICISNISLAQSLPYIGVLNAASTGEKLGEKLLNTKDPQEKNRLLVSQKVCYTSGIISCVLSNLITLVAGVAFRAIFFSKQWGSIAKVGCSTSLGIYLIFGVGCYSFLQKVEAQMKTFSEQTKEALV